MPSLAKAIGLAITSALVLIAAARFVGARLPDRDALWKIVHDRCVADQQSHGDPAPCVSVNLAERWALFKDDDGNTQFLLIPTNRVTGIEDPFILTEQAPNYWKAAWAAHRFVDQRAARSLTSDQIALAINAQSARSQDQLHIHIDCIRADVRDALRLVQPQIDANWMRITVSGQQYEVRWLSADDLHSKNLFALVAEHLQPGHGSRDHDSRRRRFAGRKRWIRSSGGPPWRGWKPGRRRSAGGSWLCHREGRRRQWLGSLILRGRPGATLPSTRRPSSRTMARAHLLCQSQLPRHPTA
jgi:CDP-diacylglycerol pyrophosphatase